MVLLPLDVGKKGYFSCNITMNMGSCPGGRKGSKFFFYWRKALSIPPYLTGGYTF